MTTGDRDRPGEEGAEEALAGAQSESAQLGPSEEMETQEAWKQVTSEFTDLGKRVRAFFELADSEPGTTSQDAIQEFIAAAGRAGRSIGAAWTDEEVQTMTKSAVSSLVEAMGASARDMADRIETTRRESDNQQ